jgi:hypothetical protein
MKAAIGKYFYKYFKDVVLDIQYKEQSKKVGFEKLKKMFQDSNGKIYYRYLNDLDLPITRKGELERVIKEVEMGLSSSELDMLLTAMEEAINGGNKPNIAQIGHLIIEIRNRKKMLIHPELLFEAVALMYIREDEDPAEVDKEITKAKISQFKKDSKEGLRDFFYTSGLTTYIPFLEKSEEEWMEYWEIGVAKMKALQTQVLSFGSKVSSN